MVRKIRLRYLLALVPATILLSYVAVAARLPTPVITVLASLLSVPYVWGSVYMISGDESWYRRAIWGVGAIALFVPYLLVLAIAA